VTSTVGNNTKNVIYTCSEGCSNGACRGGISTEQGECYKEGGNDINHAGKCFSTFSTDIKDYRIETDTCVNSERINEWTCSKGSPFCENNVYACPTGQTCVNGACVKDTCTDSDGGVKPDVYGHVYGFKNGVSYDLSDSCDDDYTLTEYYCNARNNLSQTASVGCGDGCSDGKCNSGGGGYEGTSTTTQPPQVTTPTSPPVTRPRAPSGRFYWGSSEEGSSTLLILGTCALILIGLAYVIARRKK
jgi:hypothetical protein